MPSFFLQGSKTNLDLTRPRPSFNRRCKVISFLEILMFLVCFLDSDVISAYQGEYSSDPPFDISAGSFV